VISVFWSLVKLIPVVCFRLKLLNGKFSRSQVMLAMPSLSVDLLGSLVLERY